MDPFGYAVPLGSHARWLNPRDTAHYMNRRRMIRCGGVWAGTPRVRSRRWGVSRHRRVHHLREPRSTARVRAERVDQCTTFHELGDEHDPICATRDGSMDFTVPKRPIRMMHRGLSAFTTLKGGPFFFLPGLKTMRYISTLRD